MSGVVPGDGCWDFFVSYTAADRGWAEWIAWQLEAEGYCVLVQAWDFVPGAHWMVRMSEGMRGASRTLAVVSHAYLGSVYGAAEWQAAHRADPEGFARRLLPVRVEDCPRPVLLEGIVSFDLFGLPAAEARTVLLAQVGAALAGRAKPAAEPLFPGQLLAPAASSPGAGAPPGFPNRPEASAPLPGGGGPVQVAAVRVSGTGAATAGPGGRAVSGYAAQGSGAAGPVEVGDTGDADASGGGSAVSGVDLT